MRITVIRDDGIIGIDGDFRTVDLSGMPPEVHAVQWRDTAGFVEYDNAANFPLDDIAQVQQYIDMWEAAAPPAPPELSPAELKAAAHARINAAYENAVNELTAGYPQNEVQSWAKQETEARAYMADNDAETPWLKGASLARRINIQTLAAMIISNADAIAPLHGGLTGKRQALRDAIDALGDSPTQGQLDSIVW